MPGLQVKKDSAEHQVLLKLQERYPITLEELRRELRMRAADLDLAIRNLLSMDAIELEPMPDKTFVRLKVMMGPARFEKAEGKGGPGYA
jgi:DNA-binding MarR family transcriptional regulator